MIGDVVGRIGRRVISNLLPHLKDKQNIDFVIANAENAAGGFGLTDKVAKELFGYGIDVLTSGNHIWNKKEVYQLLEEEERILRPLNYPIGVPGRGYVFLKGKKADLAVVNLCGRVFLTNIDCPFRAIMEEIEEIRSRARCIFVDMHAEVTSEKIAMGYFLDGKVSAVVGTHTHVQTADERILSGGTAYLTDVGMTGPKDGVIGIKKDIILKRFLTSIPLRLDVAKGKGIFSGVLIDINEETGEALEIKRLNFEIDEDKEGG
jgi:hypothetical protein